MRVFVRVYERNFSRVRLLPLGLQLKAGSYSHAAIGGPLAAMFTATGPVQSLLALLSWTRSPVEFWTERGELVWWGFINEVESSLGMLRLGVSLRNMANAIAVTYEEVPPNQELGAGTSATTAYAMDSESIATFGTRELVANLINAGSEVAIKQRDRLLSALKAPLPIMALDGDGAHEAKIQCIGWWGLLDGQRYSRESVCTGNATLGNNYGGGWSMDQPLYLQSFTLKSGEYSFRARGHSMQLSRPSGSNEAGNELDAWIYNDNGGAPGVAISGKGRIDAGLIATGDAWYPTYFEEPWPVLQPNTQYWFVAHYFRHWIAEATKPRWMIHFAPTDDWPYGQAYVSNTDPDGGGATPPIANPTIHAPITIEGNPHSVFLWKILGDQLTTDLIQQAINALDQGVITGVEVVNQSGVYSNSYISSDTNGLDAILQYLDAGTTNGRRLLATVLPNRKVRVYEEPVSSETADYRVGLDGTIEDAHGTRIPRATFTPARWLRLKLAGMSEKEIGLVGPISPVFIEECEYDPATDRLAHLQPRDRLSMWDIGMVMK